MEEQEKIRKKIIEFQLLDSRAKALMKKRELFLSKLLEIEATLSSIEGIEKNRGKEVYFSLGSNIYAPGILEKDRKMIVNLGANIAVERTEKETKKILEEKKNALTRDLRSMENELIYLNNQLSILEPEIRTLFQKTEK